MTVLAVLQNQWFHDPEKVKAIIERTPKARRKIITYSLFAGCRTGRVLRDVFGRERCQSIVWEEASREIGGHAASAFPADMAHLRATLDEVRPSIVLGFGKIACDALAGLVDGYDLVVGPHPTARGADTLPRLRIMAECLENMLKHRESPAATPSVSRECILNKTITIVSGFGRCGSSLLMQMLEAGGMPVTGQWPGFEAEEAGVTVNGGTISPEWLASIPGHAIKVLDPQNGKILPGDFRVIWCSRDHVEQAKSQTKLFTAIFRMPVDRATRRRFEQSYVNDKPAAVRALLACGTPSILEIRFEDVLTNPDEAAGKIAAYCGGLDVARMVAAVRRRSPMCAPGLDMELTLSAERKAA